MLPFWRWVDRYGVAVSLTLALLAGASHSVSGVVIAVCAGLMWAFAGPWVKWRTDGYDRPHRHAGVTCTRRH